MDDLIQDIQNNLFVRIASSKIDGVGLFAVKKIQVGGYPLGKGQRLIQKIRKEVVEELVEDRSLGLIKAYFNRDSKYYYFDCCSINEIRLSWYINHSLSPNIKWDGDSIIAIKEINIGEELTINYHRRVI